MASLLSDDTKTEFKAPEIKQVSNVSVPAYSDIAKSANDLLNKDFYHTAAANLEVKSKAPNGVSFTVKGKSAHEGPLSGSLEAKKTDKANGIQSLGVSFYHPLSDRRKHYLYYQLSYAPRARRRSRRKPKAPRETTSPASADTSDRVQTSTSTHSSKDAVSVPQRHVLEYTSERIPTYMLIQYRSAGITGTASWSTSNAIDAKLELDGTLAKDLKTEFTGTFKPDTQDTSSKANLTFQQPTFYGRLFADLLKGPVVTGDIVTGQQGFVAGGEVSYSVPEASISKYSASVGYIAPQYSTALTASNNFQLFSASFFQKVSNEVQAGAKASYDAQKGQTVGLELAGKYQIDPLAFVKGKVNDKGQASVSYNTKVREGFTLGLGASFDTQKLNEATHKVGAQFTFES
ncbi:MAG: hypothetical protein Q9162_005628 [Coniocarpon cinnabarinum]